MATYAYRCENCGHEFETRQSMKDDPLVHCDQCNTDSLKRVIQPAGGFRIQGRGVHKPTSRYGS
jgi:putative FmdB family regulatory protein